MSTLWIINPNNFFLSPPNNRRILKNRTKEVERPFDPMNPPLRKIEIHNPKKESLHSTKGAIESHHSAATNQGYSRKHDGGFYT